MIRARRFVKSALTFSLLALALLVLFTVSSGRPVVSYASSGSMEPTIGTLDGFLVNPFPSRIAPGDIIVFESVTRNGPAVHRVVAWSGDGWETQGDANPRADQTMGEPPVRHDRILGKVVTRADGSPILIDGLGFTIVEARADLVGVENALGGSRQLAAAAFLLLAAFAAVPAYLLRDRRKLPPRTPLRARVVLRRLFPRGVLGRHVGFALLLVVLASAVFAMANAGQDVVTHILVLQDASAGDDTVSTGRGQELSRAIEISALGLVPTVVIVEPTTHRVRTAEESVLLGPRGSGVATVWQRAGDRVGPQEDLVQVYRYPAFLPPAAILALHHTMPGLPYLALALVAVSLGALWFARLRISTLPVAGTLRIPEDWL